MAAPTTKPQLNANEMMRVSSDKQDVARQELDLADNRAQFGLNVLRTIRLKISGTLVLENEEVREMLDELARPGVDGISISAIDRLFRPKDYDALPIFSFFVRHRKVIYSTKEGLVEPWTDRGWDICMGAAQKAGAYIRELKRITQGGRIQSRRQKKLTSGTPCYGMLYVSKHERGRERVQCLIEDPADSSVPGLAKRQVVRMVFDWRYLNRLPISTIKRKLNDAGILTAGKKGQFEPGPWSRQTVIQMLKNRAYIGERLEKGEVFPCPQFVEREVFESVQKMFAEAKEMSNGRPATKHLLCGYLRCRQCRRRFRTRSKGIKGRQPSGVYICGNYDYKLSRQLCRAREIVCHKLEAIVWGAIWRHLTEAELLLANARAYYDSLPSKSRTVELERERAAVQSQMERTKRMVRAGAEDEAEGTALILADKRRITEIEAELRAAGSVMALPPARQVEAACRRIAQGPEPTTFATRRPVLEKLVDLKIIFGDGMVDIEGKVPVPEAAAAAGGGPKCNSGLTADYTSVVYIPFKIREVA